MTINKLGKIFAEICSKVWFHPVSSADWATHIGLREGYKEWLE
jgi:hypothetical protein